MVHGRAIGRSRTVSPMFKTSPSPAAEPHRLRSIASGRQPDGIMGRLLQSRSGGHAMIRAFRRPCTAGRSLSVRGRQDVEPHRGAIVLGRTVQRRHGRARLCRRGKRVQDQVFEDDLHRQAGPAGVPGQQLIGRGGCANTMGHATRPEPLPAQDVRVNGQAGAWLPQRVSRLPGWERKGCAANHRSVPFRYRA